MMYDNMHFIHTTYTLLNLFLFIVLFRMLYLRIGPYRMELLSLSSAEQ